MHIPIEPSILYFGTPVVLVSTLNPDRSPNVAPISSAWWLGWNCMLGMGARSQTPQNLLRERECVLNLPSVDQVAAVNRLARLTGSDPVPPYKTAMGYRHERSKFEVAGLTAVPSTLVKPPRVAECPIQLEAVLEESYAFGHAPYRENTTAVATEVRIVRAWVDESIRLDGHENRVDPDRWRPLIMSFCQFYGLGPQLQASTLALIPELSYRPAAHMSYSSEVTRILVSLLALGALVFAEDPENWKRPTDPFQVAGNVYYVGTEDLACYLITGKQGDILINTGLADSAPLLKVSIEKLGFQLKDIKILLTMQAHYDHVAAMAEVQQSTGAKMFATPGDKDALESGGKVDGFGDSPAYQFKPVRVDKVLKDGETILLGDTKVQVMFHSGHTKGSASYQVMADGKPVLMVNIPSVVQPLVGNKTYPKIVDDYEHSFASQKKLHPGIWLAGHASQFEMAKKQKAGSFDDPQGYADAIVRAEKAYRERLAKEQRPK